MNKIKMPVVISISYTSVGILVDMYIIYILS